VVNDLRAKGVRFVEELDDVPEGAVVVFSAHGVGESVYAEAEAKRLVVIDAACPLVKKVHNSAKRHDAENRTIILIGHAGHPEVVGTMGQIKGKMLLVTSPEDVARLEVPAGARLAYITQTTFSIKETKGTIDALRELNIAVGESTGSAFVENLGDVNITQREGTMTVGNVTSLLGDVTLTTPQGERTFARKDIGRVRLYVSL
jgi:4-hydroxy-3-methylbut-2-enyl diphosphate reductase